MKENVSALFEQISTGNADAAVEQVTAALAEGLTAEKILSEGLIAAMDDVGRRFEEGELYVPEILVSARAMKAALEILKPQLEETGVESRGTVAVGTVRGDLHDIGKNLVAMMLEGAGFEIVDLGTDLSPESFVAAVRDGASVLGLSALLTTTMPVMKETIEALQSANLRSTVKVMAGGAPITDDYAREIDADGYAADASKAVALAKSLMDAAG